MSKTHVYLRPFNSDSGIAYEDEFIEVTNDLLSVPRIKKQLDSTEYNLGIGRATSVKLKFKNEDGKYSDPGSINTVFKGKRNDTIVRITWEPGNGGLIDGFFEAGGPEPLSEEKKIFEGLLRDDSTKQDIDSTIIDLSVLGFDSLFQKIDVPFADISNGDLISDVIRKCLDQEPINDFLIVSGSTIDVGFDVAIDDKSDLENKSVKDALDELLFISNSILYIRESDNRIIVRNRDAEGNDPHEFYGPGAQGAENILDIRSFRTGVNRVFNYWRWADTNLKSVNADSIFKYGTRFNDLNSPLVTDQTKRLNLLNANVTEFADAKLEFKLEAIMDLELINVLRLNNRIFIEYPSVGLSDDLTAVYRRGIYGINTYAQEIFTLQIFPGDRFKILEIELEPENDKMILGVRKI